MKNLSKKSISSLVRNPIKVDIGLW